MIDLKTIQAMNTDDLLEELGEFEHKLYLAVSINDSQQSDILTMQIDMIEATLKERGISF